MVNRIRRRLNACDDDEVGGVDGQLWDPSVPRLYLYSKGDEVVQWEAVRDHAADARKVGFNDVVEEVFETASHVSLPREDFDRYWGTVEAWMTINDDPI